MTSSRERVRVVVCGAAALLALAAQAGGATGSGPHSVERRVLRVFHVGRMTGPSILVFGAIHGDEAAGIAIARDLLADSPSRRSNLWVVPDLNPDGVAMDTRQNAHGVDLNRNFPWRWQPAGQRGDLHYSGPQVLSEPESRFAAALVTRIHPAITIWFHQPLALVDESGGSLGVERRFARRVGLPIRRLSRYRGSATSWQNHRFPGTIAFVVELPSGALPDTTIERFAHAIEAAAR